MTKSKGTAVLSSLTGNLVVFLVLPLLLNGVIFGLGWAGRSNGGRGLVAGLPPGWVVGSLWMVLFAGMGVARWLLLKQGAGRLAEGVSAVALLCLLYPLYTAGLRNDRVGLAGDLVTAAVAVPLAVMAQRRSRGAGACLGALCVWLLYAAAATAYGLSR